MPALSTGSTLVWFLAEAEAVAASFGEILALAFSDRVFQGL